MIFCRILWCFYWLAGGSSTIRVKSLRVAVRHFANYIDYCKWVCRQKRDVFNYRVDGLSVLNNQFNRGNLMKMIFDQKSSVVKHISALLLILVCIHFLDAKVALNVKSFLQANPSLKNRVKYIPNMLPIIVSISTVTLWLGYLSGRTRLNNIHVGFLKLAAIVVPVSYLLKMFLQFAFGRTHIRYWLNNGGPIEFNWFTSLAKFPCFPSGHMTVITAFLTTIWLFYPRCRLFVIVALFTLAFSLVITNYHFLGDVVAGFWCGIVITVVVNHLMKTC